MCGIIGAITADAAIGCLLTGLKRLEYRGYDSAGVALLNGSDLELRKSVGKLANLAELVEELPPAGRVGIGHTRWATHGRPNEANCHPHRFGDIAVVHNGIIENYRELRAELAGSGHVFDSETDTEVVAHLLQEGLLRGQDPAEAMIALAPRLEGSYALAFLVRGRNEIFAASRGSPLVIGHSSKAMYVASDGLALAPFTNRLTYLEEGDCATISQSGAKIRGARGSAVHRQNVLSKFAKDASEKGGYRHFMLKEINEQPAVIRRTLSVYLDGASKLPALPFAWQGLERLSIVACGSSAYAAQIAKYWFEQQARLPVDADIASEYRYRERPQTESGAALFISQSGETADTLAALRRAKQAGQPVVSLVNVPESALAREADATLRTYAGPEISVVSTKAFTAQLTALACLAMAAARERGTADDAALKEFHDAVVRLPLVIEALLEHPTAIEETASKISGCASALFMGRGTGYPLALEGALKLKEISYIHAEGFGAGELKHGPIALAGQHLPVIAIAPKDELYSKILSSVHEVRAHGAQVYALTDDRDFTALADLADRTFVVPAKHPLVRPIAMAVPLQLLAYHVALRKDTDIDQPRNLAKSVTVE